MDLYGFIWLLLAVGREKLTKTHQNSPFQGKDHEFMNRKTKRSRRNSLCARSFEREISINDPFKWNQKDLHVTFYLIFKAIAPQSQRKNDMLLGMQ